MNEILNKKLSFAKLCDRSENLIDFEIPKEFIAVNFQCKINERFVNYLSVGSPHFHFSTIFSDAERQELFFASCHEDGQVEGLLSKKFGDSLILTTSFESPCNNKLLNHNVVGLTIKHLTNVASSDISFSTEDYMFGFRHMFAKKFSIFDFAVGGELYFKALEKTGGRKCVELGGQPEILEAKNVTLR
ncbi:hypothetical protein O9G_001915 [Rozella allomycis CSF55]|uniref:Uncharacterized protein n=1 Tax=Rozella allomycis (strain CSF55) TaxID=988480 RepID=A0A075B1G0_ROZAC|nr:hypothetical protein O9G_001915 [Rozella allomycis CSF55]|eukprot:EPZ34613.1 hypothetical protein O9G_001915 [Rozella allomycis CSF55]